MLDNFDNIVATNGINVLLRKSSENKAEIKVNNALLSDVTTEVSNGTLKLKMRPQINKEISILVTVSYKNINSLTATKGASIQTRTVMLTDKLEFNTNTGGEIKAEVECQNLNVEASGSSSISLYGWSERYEAKAGTKGKIDSKKLNAERVIAKASTGGEVWVFPKAYLEAIATMGGTVYYINKPEDMNERVSSGGEVVNKVQSQAIGNDLIRNADE